MGMKLIIPNKEIYMSSIADSSVIIQSSSENMPCPPPWFGEVALIVEHLRQQGVLTKIGERIRFARRRFGHYEVIDFLAVLFGYAISGERTLQAFYEAVRPFASAFMALFGRGRLLARPLAQERQTGGLVDRCGVSWIVFDIDGTREAARQRALPQTADLPAAQRRLQELCAPGYTGRKRGEVVRTRTVISQAHSYQWLGSFGNQGNGHYR